MRARWPRSLLALFFAGSAGALGMAALSAGPAGAATEAPKCGGALQPLCPPQAPQITATTSENDGTITITWTGVGQGVNPMPGIPTMTWNPAPVDSRAPNAPTPGAVPLEGGSCPAVGGGTVVCTYPWPAGLIDSGYVLNGNYTVNASATDCVLAGIGCSTPTNAAVPVAVNNPAAPPSGVKTTNPTPNTVKITWAPNGEPDITGYQVFRDKDRTPVCTVSVFQVPVDNSCVDAPLTDGPHSYRVVAYRWSPSYSPKVADQPASASSPTATATVSGTAANTTTTTAPGGGANQTLGPNGFAGKPTPGKPLTGGLGTGSFHSKPGSAVTAPAAVDNPATGDTGFQPNLPYGQQPTTVPPADGTAIAAPPVVHKGKTSVGTIAVIGAGLLVAVIALHGLWLRSEVRRAGTLEALDPEV